MRTLITRYPVLTDARVLSFVAAAVLAVISFVATGDPAAAGVGINNGR